MNSYHGVLYRRAAISKQEIKASLFDLRNLLVSSSSSFLLLVATSFLPFALSSFLPELGIRASSPKGSDSSFLFSSADSTIACFLSSSSLPVSVSPFRIAASSMSSSSVANGRLHIASFNLLAVFENYIIKFRNNI